RLYFSKKSRYSNIAKEGSKEKINDFHDEMLYKYSLSILKENKEIDYFVFGHRHLPMDIRLNEKTRFMILGDWLTNFSYAVFDGNELELKYYK
ncbi:MAG: UDP-2,3-diacylglucosamine diphosphatase, partial [Bacteroidales bacterium]|nr:UDP-2,3-diacylglucosamine diphosphatase [Bacteroidales bacterium]